MSLTELLQRRQKEAAANGLTYITAQQVTVQCPEDQFAITEFDVPLYEGRTGTEIAVSRQFDFMKDAQTHTREAGHHDFTVHALVDGKPVACKSFHLK